MVRIENEPGEPPREVWAYLSPTEAKWLLQALEYWFEEGRDDPDWHHHVGSPEQSGLTIAIGDAGLPVGPTSEAG